MYWLWKNLCLPWKTELPWTFSLCWNIFYLSEFLSNLHLPWKTVCPEIFHCIEYIFSHSQHFWATCACAEKQCGLNSLYWIYIFYHSNFDQLALALKNRICPEIFNCRPIERFFIIQDFWATCACPENRAYPEIFHCIKYTLYIQDSWATCACPEKQSVPWIHCIEYRPIFFTIQNFKQLPLALKNRVCPKIFPCIEIFLSFRIFEQVVLALKTEFALNFSSRGGRPTPCLVRHCL